MGATKQVTDKFAADLKDYTDTTAAIHLLKEALTGGAVITVGAAQDIVAKENLKQAPKIGNVIKEIMALAGKPGEDQAKWVKSQDDQKWHLQAAITIGGAVYTVDFTHDGDKGGEQQYTVDISSKLAVEEGTAPTRGKLFFNPGNKAKVSLKVDKDGDLFAVTKKGLTVGATSFSNFPFQTEIISKYADELGKGHDGQLALAGTGSGKSIIMAGIAQGLGRTVMIVPDALLVNQQTKEVQSMHGAGKVNGKQVNKPVVFTFDSIKGAVEDINDADEVLEFFKSVLNGTSDPVYDQIVLQSTHPLFKVVVPGIKDTMVLIDEAHTHTFTKQSTELLTQLRDNNSILALTATPTTELYSVFPGTPLDDLSLGAAIEIGTVRPIKAEVSYHDDTDLITQAVVNYFNDYYLTPTANGYVNPVDLVADLMSKGLDQTAAQQRAIDIALEQNRLRCQRNTAFSDDKATRTELATIYQKISEGDQPTINKYKDAVANLRQQSEALERRRMTALFNGLVEKVTPVPTVELDKDIEKEQQKAVQRTINSYALALVFGEKPASIGEKDRTHKLQAQLGNWDQAILKYHPSDEYHTNNDIPPHLLKKFEECHNHTPEKLREALLKMESPIPDLPQPQQEAMIKLILERAEEISDNIRFSNPISDLVMQPAPIKLKATDTRFPNDKKPGLASYTGQVDTSTTDDKKKGIVAMLEAGLTTHVVSDESIATGVSIKDVLNAQIINNYSPVVESNPNAINGTLSGPQGMGRTVRHTDVLARDQQFIDSRYRGTRMILTVDEAIDRKNSATYTKEVMMARDVQSKKEVKAAVFVQSHHRAHATQTMFAKHKDELTTLTKDIEKCRGLIQLQQDKLDDGRRYLASTQQKLHVSEVALAFVPGNKNGRIPAQWRNEPDTVRHWTQRKVLPRLIEQIKQTNKPIAEAIKANTKELHRMEERKEKLLQKIENAVSHPKSANL